MTFLTTFSQALLEPSWTCAMYHACNTMIRSHCHNSDSWQKHREAVNCMIPDNPFMSNWPLMWPLGGIRLFSNSQENHHMKLSRPTKHGFVHWLFGFLMFSCFCSVVIPHQHVRPSLFSIVLVNPVVVLVSSRTLAEYLTALFFKMITSKVWVFFVYG